jgi:hypothetical protein
VKIYADEKPSLEDLAHHGVKGMKWGQRKARPSTSDIHDARARQASRQNEINQNIGRLNLAKSGSKQQDALAKKVATGMDKFDTNKDAAVAARMTKGEKAAAVMLTGPIGLLVIGANKAHVKKLEKIQK